MHLIMIRKLLLCLGHFYLMRSLGRKIEGWKFLAMKAQAVENSIVPNFRFSETCQTSQLSFLLLRCLGFRKVLCTSS